MVGVTSQSCECQLEEMGNKKREGAGQAVNEAHT